MSLKDTVSNLSGWRNPLTQKLDSVTYVIQRLRDPTTTLTHLFPPGFIKCISPYLLYSVPILLTKITPKLSSHEQVSLVCSGSPNVLPSALYCYVHALHCFSPWMFENGSFNSSCSDAFYSVSKRKTASCFLASFLHNTTSCCCSSAWPFPSPKVKAVRGMLKLSRQFTQEKFPFTWNKHK